MQRVLLTNNIRCYGYMNPILFLINSIEIEGEDFSFLADFIREDIFAEDTSTSMTPVAPGPVEGVANSISNSSSAISECNQTDEIQRLLQDLELRCSK